MFNSKSRWSTNFDVFVVTIVLSISTLMLILVGACGSLIIWKELQQMNEELNRELSRITVSMDRTQIDLKGLQSTTNILRIRRALASVVNAQRLDAAVLQRRFSVEDQSALKFNSFNDLVQLPSYAQLTSPLKSEAACVCSTPQVSNRCPAGPTGSRGVKGFDGSNGLDGIPGRRGYDAPDRQRLNPVGCFVCPRGRIGAPGPTGRPGPRGMRGVRGSVGINGLDGLVGEIGEVGVEGKRGQIGGRGLPGVDGQSGIRLIKRRGKKGKIGPRGENGGRGDVGKRAQMGLEGPKGIKGLNGSIGVVGRAGTAGIDGQKGAPGADSEYCPCPNMSRHR